MWIGVDDTDSPEGGCTTHVLTEIVRVARDRGVDVLGEPRLVRLNPNIPWKTRGNAALSVRLGTGAGARRRIGVIGGRPVWSHSRGRPVPSADRAALVDALWQAVLDGSRSENATDPAMVAGDRPLPVALYERAVRSVVPLEDAEAALQRAGYETRVRGSRRGLVGAAAAVAWPGRRATWELLAYRRPARWGAPRRISSDSVRSVRRKYPSLFLCYDARTRRVLVAPHTPCPILYGLRSTNPAILAAAARGVRSESVERWLRFRTNQGTGDHVRRPVDGALEPFASGRLTGTVSAAPADLRGGHVRLQLNDRKGRPVTCLSFEPSKTLPAVVRSLLPGETVELWGGRGEDAAFRIEGVVLGTRAILRTPGPRPRCPRCGRATRSIGRGRGYRCTACRVRLPPEARPESEREARFGPGTYHPTPSARRHLAPLGPEGDPGTDL
jgi:tRNA(Ile2)-agmatinylcytidine synthase